MTLYGLRLLVALMTFAVGTAAAWLFDFKSPQPAEGRVVTTEVLRFTHTTDVEVPARSCYYSRRFVAGGILNGKALSKPAPVYPPAAKAKGVVGTVAVDVVVDENGMVETAEAVSGPELLRDAAVVAARATSFPPTRLSGQPVKVSGTITYNFVLD